MQSTVYVIIKHVQYEDSTPIEVHTDKRIADKRAKQYNQDDHNRDVYFEVVEVPLIGELTS